MLANVLHLYSLHSINNIKNGNDKTLNLICTNVHNKISVNTGACPFVNEDIHHPAPSVNIHLRKEINTQNTVSQCTNK